MQTEFNWYIVARDENLSVSVDTLFGSPTSETNHQENWYKSNTITLDNDYLIIKKDYRVYPMDTPLPLIYNGKCLAMAVVTKMTWNCNETILNVTPIVIFSSGDSAALYYEESFEDYKKAQVAINDGGKVDLRNVVNPTGRKRFS